MQLPKDVHCTSCTKYCSGTHCNISCRLYWWRLANYWWRVQNSKWLRLFAKIAQISFADDTLPPNSCPVFEDGDIDNGREFDVQEFCNCMNDHKVWPRLGCGSEASFRERHKLNFAGFWFTEYSWYLSYKENTPGINLSAKHPTSFYNLLMIKCDLTLWLFQSIAIDLLGVTSVLDVPKATDSP